MDKLKIGLKVAKMLGIIIFIVASMYLSFGHPFNIGFLLMRFVSFGMIGYFVGGYYSYKDLSGDYRELVDKSIKIMKDTKEFLEKLRSRGEEEEAEVASKTNEEQDND